MPHAERVQLMLEENQWKNSLFTWILPTGLVQVMPHWVQTWYRNWIAVQLVYFIVGALWCYYTYFCFGDVLFAPGTIPSWKDVAEQMKVSAWLLPAIQPSPLGTRLDRRTDSQ